MKRGRKMITKEEYLELKKLYNDGYRWIARDSCEIIYAYKLEPIKLAFSWKYSKNNMATTCGDDFLLPYVYVKWEDEKPTLIADLINEYEAHKLLVGEKVKVTIPQFVADWIDECKKSKLFFSNLNLLEEKAEVKNWIYEHDNGDDTTMKREEMVIKAYYDGYVVEKEKLYTVELPNPNKIGNEVNVLMKNGFRQIVIKQEFGDGWKKENGFRLTEAEIKKDFEWAWQFAEEVE